MNSTVVEIAHRGFPEPRDPYSLWQLTVVSAVRNDCLGSVTSIRHQELSWSMITGPVIGIMQPRRQARWKRKTGLLCTCADTTHHLNLLSGEHLNMAWKSTAEDKKAFRWSDESLEQPMFVWMVSFSETVRLRRCCVWGGLRSQGVNGIVPAGCIWTNF